MTNLKPCPFCGSEAHIYRKPTTGGYAPACNNDRCEVYWQREYGTETEAIAAWNNRAGRTCHMTYNEEWSGDEYYPTQAYTCYKCGWITEMGVPRYCPSCGAKVVEE